MTQTPRTPPQQHTAGRRTRRRGRRCIAATALLLLALTALPWRGTVAHAHASLLESSPADGALLAAAPETLQLTFNEDVTLLETTRLRGPVGETPYTADVDGGLVTLRPGQTLADGRWDLIWQIVSADGHLVGGVLAFTIGTTPATDELLEETPEATAYTTDDPTGVPAETGAPGALDRILELLGWISLIGALGTLLAAKRTPAGWLGAGAVLIPALRIVDSVDRWGTSAWIIGETRAALAATLAGALLLAAALLPERARTLRTVLAALGVLAWAAQALLSGHPNVIDPQLLYAALSALHLAGALTWSAGVSAVVIAPVRARTASRVATIGIALLLPGAILLASAFLPDAFEHGAGRWEGILAAKTVLVLGALGLGWHNHRACRCQRCRRHDCSSPLEPDTRRQLRRRAGIEIGLIALVAVLSASLTASVPARITHAGSADTATSATSATTATTGTPDTDDVNDPADAGAPTGTSLVDAGRDGEPRTTNATLLFENGETGELLLETRPDGTAVIHLVLRQADGAPFTAEQVEYELENQELGITGLGGNLPVSGGMHMGETDLPSGGTWRISVRATYDTFTTITATAEIQTPWGAPGTGTQE